MSHTAAEMTQVYCAQRELVLGRRNSSSSSQCVGHTLERNRTDTEISFLKLSLHEQVHQNAHSGVELGTLAAVSPVSLALGLQPS